ncbi:hypothetical protein AJ80_07770 [Polytolypa hystricis UAMH7299]|uniref:Fe2OG dioxygenase domain-containing protein n=1 Tax=Polytolypa hystricis (strain UAMH7299) TaxID=1447883 RepID=A0A2B7XJ49_POLH7|nr:hypothetical protein AJ80_07770 [Polytolypa hystricis UAMH7299]
MAEHQPNINLADESILSNGLEKWRISSLPNKAYYIPEFITEDEEERLLQKINSVPLPRWTQLSKRRLQTWPCALTKSNTLLAAPLPQWLISPIIQRFEDFGIFSDSPHQAPNHVLINEYQPGQGIMPHEDGAAYHPIVATVSLSTPIILDVMGKNGADESRLQEQEDENGGLSESTKAASRYRILQEPRSLLVTTEALYTDHLHGIADRVRDEDLSARTICNWDLLGDAKAFEVGGYDRETRVSLTYRDVLKVSKLGNSMKFLGAR